MVLRPYVVQSIVSEWETGAYRPRGASQRLLLIVAERARFPYTVGAEASPDGEQEHQ